MNNNIVPNLENLKRFTVIKNIHYDYSHFKCQNCGADITKPNDVDHLVQCSQCGVYNVVFIPLDIYAPLKQTWIDYHNGSRLVRKYLLYGGKGSAKSSHIMDFNLELIFEFAGYRVLYLSETIGQTIAIVKAFLKSFCPPELYKFVDNKETLATFFFTNGSTIEVRDSKTENKFGSILWDTIVCEEAKWLHLALDKSLYARLGRGSMFPSCQIITINPDSNPYVLHMIKSAKDIFVTEGVDINTNSKLIYSQASTSEKYVPILIDSPSNPYLTPEFIRENFELDNPDWYKTHVALSLDFVDTNLVPVPLTIDDVVCPQTPFDLDDTNCFYYGGIDWGYKDATTLVIIKYDITTKCYTVVDTFEWRKHTLQEVGVLISKTLKEKYNWEERTNMLEIICDRSAGNIQLALGMPLLDYVSNLGLSVLPYNDIVLKERNNVKNANSLHPKINKVRDLFSLKQLRISDNCQDLISEIRDTPVIPTQSPVTAIQTFKIQRKKKGGHGDCIMGLVYGIWGCDTFTPPTNPWEFNQTSKQFYFNRNFGIKERFRMLHKEVEYQEEDSIINSMEWEDEIF